MLAVLDLGCFGFGLFWALWWVVYLFVCYLVFCCYFLFGLVVITLCCWLFGDWLIVWWLFGVYVGLGLGGFVGVVSIWFGCDVDCCRVDFM